MWGNPRPDHDTICTFRKRFLAPLGELFTQILPGAAEMDMVKLGDVSIDGSKFKANASKHKAMSWDRARELEDQLSEEVAKLLAAAEAADQEQEDDRQLPEELERRHERLGQIREAKAMIEERAAERYEERQAEYTRESGPPRKSGRAKRSPAANQNRPSRARARETR